MTHLTPTPRPKAPPLPLRGEGMGVGGHPSRSRRVRIHGAPLLAALLLATPLSAQIIPTGSPAADILLSQALTEHRTFLTCSALDPATHAQITDAWLRDVTAATAILAENQVPPAAIEAFTTAAKPENLMPTPDTPFATVRDLCASQADWVVTYSRMRFTNLDRKLPEAFE